MKIFQKNVFLFKILKANFNIAPSQYWDNIVCQSSEYCPRYYNKDWTILGKMLQLLINIFQIFVEILNYWPRYWSRYVQYKQ